jgi:hypothetical protein
MDTERRLAALEGKLRNTRRALLGLGVGLLLVCAAAAASPFAHLVCAGLEVKNSDGKTVLTLSDDGGLRTAGKLEAPAVPPGMMLPYFGRDLPKGFVWADGEARWPEAPWVPSHLRGARVPDMREHLVGGANNEAVVGKVFKTGQLSVPEFTVDGSNFKIPVNNSRVDGGYTYALVWQNEAGIEIGKNIPPDNKLPNWFQAAADDKYRGFWMRLQMAPATYKAPAGATAGSQKVSGLKINLDSASTNPRHVMCRWIIRVE